MTYHLESEYSDGDPSEATDTDNSREFVDGLTFVLQAVAVEAATVEGELLFTRTDGETVRLTIKHTTEVPA